MSKHGDDQPWEYILTIQAMLPRMEVKRLTGLMFYGVLRLPAPIAECDEDVVRHEMHSLTEVMLRDARKEKL